MQFVDPAHQRQLVLRHRGSLVVRGRARQLQDLALPVIDLSKFPAPSRGLGPLGGRHKHEIPEPLVISHVDGHIGLDLLKFEPFCGLHHVRAHGPVEPLCF